MEPCGYWHQINSAGQSALVKEAGAASSCSYSAAPGAGLLLCTGMQQVILWAAPCMGLTAANCSGKFILVLAWRLQLPGKRVGGENRPAEVRCKADKNVWRKIRLMFAKVERKLEESHSEKLWVQQPWIYRIKLCDMFSRPFLSSSFF